MIDWIAAVVPYPHTKEISGGFVRSVDARGEIEWDVLKGLKIEGSHSSTVLLKSTAYCDGIFRSLYVSGNPLKLLQGHNLFGSWDLKGLLRAMIETALSAIDLPYTELDQMRWFKGDGISIKRADLTKMLDLGNVERARAYLHALSQTTYLRHRGRGEFTEATLYFGKKSRRWAIKVYVKFDEINSRKKGHGISQGFTPDFYRALYEYAAPAVRVECVLRSNELRDNGIDGGTLWNETFCHDLAEDYMGKLDMTGNVKLPNDVLLNLKGYLRSTYTLWTEGHDLRNQLSKTQYYRHRRELIEHGIDIGVPSDKVERSNVVPLVQYLTAKEMTVPEWAHGTPLYFNPTNTTRIKACK